MLKESLEALSVEKFARYIDEEWVAAALEVTGKVSVRKRKFPAERVAWLVVGMALFAAKSIEEVVAHLGLVLPGKTIVRGALPQARYRVGPEPIMMLFRQAAKVWRERLKKQKWHGLELFALDGTCLKVQDSDENYERFGKPSGQQGEGGYPQVRVVVRMDLGQRMIVDAEFGPYRTSELELAKPLWSQIPGDSLTILDRGFNAYPVLAAVVDEGRNRHVLLRLRDDLKPQQIRELSDGSGIVRIVPDKPVRAEFPGIRSEIIGRVIEYQVSGGKRSRLFTTLLDEKTFPASVLVALYHDRWEIELGYDELKTHMLERKESLRSKKPEGVEQELWGIFLAYNLVRFEMAQAAEEFGVLPNEMSFRHCLEMIRIFFIKTAWIAPPTKLTHRLAELREQLQLVGLLVLPPRRPERRYPREVKVVASRFPRNRGKRAPTLAGKLK